MLNPLISVIIPVYNVEDYLDRCMKSVLSQSYNNLEIILVDDGSTDTSGQKCDQYEGYDSRVRVIHQVNMGLGGARNTGIEAANGEYICFIDSDDYISNYYVETMVIVALNESSDIIVCHYKRGKCVDYPFENSSVASIEITKDSTDVLSEWHGIHKDIETIAWNKMYKRKLFFSGIRYPLNMYFEDVSTTHRIVAESKRISIIKNCLYYYYQRGNSIKGSITDKKLQQRQQMNEQRLQWFKDSPYAEAYARLLSKVLKYHMDAFAQATNVEFKNSILISYQRLLNENMKHLSVFDSLLFKWFYRRRDFISAVYRRVFYQRCI